MPTRALVLPFSLAASLPLVLFACGSPQGVVITGVPDAGGLYGSAGDAAYPEPEPPGDDAAGPPSCDPDGGLSCGGACLDGKSDATNCGGCGNVCGAGQLCDEGACVADVLAKLPFDVVDAEYARPLDRIVIVSATPPALHVYDPGAGVDRAVALPKAPTAVSVGPDGHKAAVGHDALVSYVDLDALAVLGAFPVSAPVGDLVLAGNGYVYAFPSSDQWVSIHAVDVATGAEQVAAQQVYAGMRAKLHPSGASLYAADTGLSPSSLYRFDLSGPTATQSGESFGVTYSVCGALWIAKDGLRVFTGCGNVFRASTDPNQDLQYAGSLAAQPTYTPTIVSVDDSGAQVAALVSSSYYGASPTSDQLVIYDAQYLAQQSAKPLPRYAAGPRSVPTTGKHVFFRGDGSLVAIVQADPSSNAALPFALARF